MILNYLVTWRDGVCLESIDELLFTSTNMLVCIQCHKAKNLVPEGGNHKTRTGEAVL